MSSVIIPTDSILRRHFEQHAAAAGFPPPPEDSVLRRHYEQQINARDAAASDNPAPTAPATPQAKPVTASPSAPAAPSRPAENKGWFARLMGKLFGGG